MRYRYEQLGEDMAAYQQECAAMKHDQVETMKFKQKMSADAEERDDLKLQLSAKDAQIKSMNVKHERIQMENQTLAQKVIEWKDYGGRTYKSYKQERSKAQEEAKKRVQAEKRLKEILDAQKKITAMYSGFGK
jgi:hypothetical protein